MLFAHCCGHRMHPEASGLRYRLCISEQSWIYLTLSNPNLVIPTIGGISVSSSTKRLLMLFSHCCGHRMHPEASGLRYRLCISEQSWIYLTLSNPNLVIPTIGGISVSSSTKRLLMLFSHCCGHRMHPEASGLRYRFCISE